jgi:DnaK suppressor protein
MNHLTSEELVELESELTRQLEGLERSMRITDSVLEPVRLDQTAVGRLSRIDSLQNQSLARNLQDREKARHGQIQGALARIRGGTYGFCVECSAAIPFGRLYVFAEAPTCASCGSA